MRRTRLFNRYHANAIGQRVYKEIRAAVLPILNRAARKGYDLHDFELMMTRAVELDCAMLRARRPARSRVRTTEGGNG